MGTAGSGISGGVAGAGAGREPEVMGQINLLEQALGTLADAVQGLTKRLEAISKTDTPPPENRKGEVDVNVCPLAATLRSFRHRVNNIRKAVEEQVARLEI